MSEPLLTLSFASAAGWTTWLAKHHQSANGIWLKFAKKASGIPSVSYGEALDVALCYGWIDGLQRSFNEDYYIQKFTPRRPQSLWSKRNIEKVTKLIAEGKMQPAGLAAINAAKQDGRWSAAYDSPKNMPFPEDFLHALEKNEKAKAYFATLNASNRYAIAFRLATAKKVETRKRRFDKLMAMLERGEFR